MSNLESWDPIESPGTFSFPWLNDLKIENGDDILNKTQNILWMHKNLPSGSLCSQTVSTIPMAILPNPVPLLLSDNKNKGM